MEKVTTVTAGVKRLYGDGFHDALAMTSVNTCVMNEHRINSSHPDSSSFCCIISHLGPGASAATKYPGCPECPARSGWLDPGLQVLKNQSGSWVWALLEQNAKHPQSSDQLGAFKPSAPFKLWTQADMMRAPGTWCPNAVRTGLSTWSSVVWTALCSLFNPLNLLKAAAF